MFDASGRAPLPARGERRPVDDDLRGRIRQRARDKVAGQLRFRGGLGSRNRCGRRTPAAGDQQNDEHQREREHQRAMSKEPSRVGHGDTSKVRIAGILVSCLAACNRLAPPWPRRHKRSEQKNLSFDESTLTVAPSYTPDAWQRPCQVEVDCPNLIPNMPGPRRDSSAPSWGSASQILFDLTIPSSFLMNGGLRRQVWETPDIDV